MRIVGWDTETHPFTTDEPIPRVVCHTFFYQTDALGTQRDIQLGTETLIYFLKGAIEGHWRLVAHNAAFDLAATIRTWPELTGLVFQALDAGGVICTQRQFELHKLQVKGEVPVGKAATTLATVAKEFAGMDLDKGSDTWRLRYSELDGVPLKLWPEAATKYALRDAEAVYRVAKAMPMSPDTANQTRYSVAFHLMSAWGMRVDPELLGTERKRLDAERTEAVCAAQGWGYMRANGTKDMAEIKSAIEGTLGASCPRTDAGAVKTDRLTMELLPADHPVRAVDDIKRAEKLLSYLDAYQAAADAGRPVRPRVNVLKNTGRTSMAEPNLQNLPQKGQLRELFVARPGCVFANADLGTAELRSLGQACLDTVGFSKMAELFQREPRADPHQVFADGQGGSRQDAKAVNFALPGGMGPKTFLGIRQRAGVDITYPEVQQQIQAWHLQWPEMQPYFDWVTRVCDTTREITLPVSGRVRGHVTFCNGANTGFQGRTADVAKYWCYLIVKESLTCSTSPLWGCHLVNFIHDEVIVECPESYAHEAAMRICDLAEVAGSYHLPDVPTVSDPALMERWYKKAEPVYEGERLVPWRPE